MTMYAYIEVTVEQVSENGIILDHDGMGYEITMPQSDISRLDNRTERIRIYTYFQATESGLLLCGFLSKEDKELFLLLISVSGVGPKAALALLGTHSAESLRFAIVGEDEKTLSMAPGIGKKTARRIILELKDRIDPMQTVEEHLDRGGVVAVESSERSDALAALVALGYSSSEVLSVFSKLSMDEKSLAEDWIREALKEL